MRSDHHTLSTTETAAYGFYPTVPDITLPSQMTLCTDQKCRPPYYKPSFLLLNLIHQPLMFRKHTQLYLCSLLLLCSGDVHPNPGPDSSSSSSLSGYSHILNNNGLSIMHLNIQSLRPNLTS
ncbi:hypothetical protein DPMN_173874 [Dreissena polymorpha]|uniref:Uncharacterized protein n=1 Tax=Dreissena polymorpha TaxID=45954 RepID=A0A9D4IGJ4_DREPO|nr:hypothetical protein DPMN_173874 [Dreissena polymorpha]